MAHDELYDEWENEGSGGAPVLSWKFSEPGEPSDTFTGVIVPPNPLTAPAKGYQPVVDRNKDGARVWPPKVGYQPKAGVNPKAPISESEYLNLTNGDASEMREVTLTEVTLVTGYSNKEFMSAPRKAAAREDPEFVDNGVRRFLVDGADIPPKFRAAVQKLKTKGPQPGQRLTIKFLRREPNVGKDGEKNIFEVTLEAPTPETMKIVEKWVAEAKSSESSATAGDEWTKSDTTTSDEAPPF